MNIFKKMFAVIMAVVAGVTCVTPAAYAVEDCATILTFVKNEKNFNTGALRENSIAVGFLTTASYVTNEKDTEKAARLDLSYASGGSLLWESYNGFTLRPRLDTSKRDTYLKMKINMPDIDKEKYFYVMDDGGKKAFVPVLDYMKTSDAGIWTEANVPLADFYDTNLNMDKTKLMSIGIAWRRSSSTTKTASTPTENIYVTDAMICRFETPEAYIIGYEAGKIKIGWSKVQVAESYNIYNNKTLIGNTKQLSYEIESEYTGSDFEFFVSAVDAYGTESIKSRISTDMLNTNSENTAYIIHDDNLPTAGYTYYWPNSDQTSGGKYMTASVVSNAFSGTKAQKITYPARLSWGSFQYGYGYALDFSEYVNKASLTLRIKSSKSSSELSVRLTDTLDTEINLGSIALSGSGEWEKIEFPLSDAASGSFRWNSVKKIIIGYSGAKRYSSLEITVDLIQLEYFGNEYTIYSDAANPDVLGPQNTYYAICDATGKKEVYAAYYDGEDRLLNVSKGNRIGDQFISVIRTGTSVGNDYKIKLISFSEDMKPASAAGSIVSALTKDLSVATGKWYKYDQPDYNKIAGTALDMSVVLDAPAGKHGFVRAVGENFVFEDGTGVDFWGTNIVGQSNFLEKSQIDTMVNAIAAAGFNVVRVHHLDANYYSPNIFGSDKNSTSLDSNQMDKFNYLFYKLKEKGIYVMPSLLCSRVVTSAMGVTDANSIDAGMKIEGMFDEKLIQMQKDYAKALLTYKNPYTGKTLATDPASVMFEIQNECSIVRYGENATYSISSSYYYNKFTALFTQWLIDKYGSRSAISSAWGETVASSGSIDFPANYLSKNYSAKHLYDCRSFLNHIAREYHQGMIDYLKNELGVKVPIAGTNNASSDNLGDVYENAYYDYMDRHQYWSHPSNGYEMANGLKTNSPGSVLKSQGMNPFYELAKNNVYGKPMVVTEWQSGLPNVYGAEIQMVAASVFAYQGFSACEFDFLNGPMIEKNMMGDAFGIMGNPLRYGLLPAASLSYHTTREAQSGFWISVSESDAMTVSKQSIDSEPLAFMIGKVGLDIKSVTGAKATNASDFTTKLYSAMRKGVYESSTDELSWDLNNGIFTVDTPYVKSATGFIKGEKIKLDNVTINVGNDFAAVSVTSPDAQPVEEADRLLVTAAARGMNSGFETDSSASTVLDMGGAPILLEQVEGTVSIEGTDFDVYVLSSSGERIKTANTCIEDGFTVLEMGISDKTMHYEFVRR